MNKPEIQLKDEPLIPKEKLLWKVFSYVFLMGIVVVFGADWWSL